MPTPTSVRRALQPQPATVAGHVLQPLNGDTYLFLEEIQSPLLFRAAEGRPAYKMLDMFAVLFVLTHPVEDCLALWAQGEPVFKAAVIGFGKNIPLDSLEEIAQAVIEHIAAAFEPAAQLHPPLGEDGRPLAAGPMPTPTASAGSAGSSPGSPASGTGNQPTS